MQALYAGGPTATVSDTELVPEELRAMTEAVEAQRTVMERWSISFAELQDLMFHACNSVRLEIGKTLLSKQEYLDLYSQGMVGARARFYA